MKIGILGTARVVYNALLQPVRNIPGVDVVAVASRSLSQARKFSETHGIPKAFSSYEALLSDAEIDSVYIALPTALHAHWACRSLECGKHVLCEKPLASNAALASHAASVSQSTGLVLQEGMHLLHLKTICRQREIVKGGELGRMLRVSCVVRHPSIEMIEGDFRLNYELGGGAALDLGCYAIAFLTYMVEEIDPTVYDVEVLLESKQVDRWMKGSMRFPSGIFGAVECGFRGDYSPDMSITVECEGGLVRSTQDGVVLITPEKETLEEVPQISTFQRQLEEFRKQTQGLSSEALPLHRSISNTLILDAMYERAGLAPRIGI